jgi:hypothetical protein
MRSLSTPFCIERAGAEIEGVLFFNVYKGEPRGPHYPGCPPYLGEMRLVDPDGYERFLTPSEFKAAEAAAWQEVKRADNG